jgi:hypothetical protein
VRASQVKFLSRALLLVVMLNLSTDLHDREEGPRDDKDLGRELKGNRGCGARQRIGGNSLDNRKEEIPIVK